MQSCFLICHDNQTCTAFIYRNADRAVFVTANHGLLTAKVGDNVLFKRGDDWVPFVLTGLWRDEAGFDACAFAVDEFSVGGHWQSKWGGALFPGEPVKFLGFPHGLNGVFPGQGFPTPLVRTAYLSGAMMIDGLPITILDGFNNPGFSGGPVYVTHDGETSLFAIISGYRVETRSHSRIYKINDRGDEEFLPDVYVKPNSGMIHSIGIDAIMESLFKKIDGSLIIKE